MLVSRRLALTSLLGLCLPSGLRAQERVITLASTTAPEQSGLFDRLLPDFTAKSGVLVRVESVGTGRALDLARQGKADIAVVHDRDAEEKFIAEGHGIGRFEVMRDEFVLLGPKSDPANVRGLKDVREALRRIAATKATFVSRRDRSGTSAAELRYWKDAGVDIGWIKGIWYKEVRQGSVPALNAAAEQDAYTLVEHSAWTGFNDRRNLAVLIEGDKLLVTHYAVVLVNPQKHPNVKDPEARAFADWLLSPECQNAIAGYKIDGEQLFIPSAAFGDYRLRDTQS